MEGVKPYKGPSLSKEDRKLRELKRKCFYLWSSAVKNRAGKKCEACSSTKKLNAHHIENFNTNKTLRYDVRNGVCLCPRCHKFGPFSAHRSFIFMYQLMTTQRPYDVAYLEIKRGKPTKLTVEYLELVIKNFNTTPKPKRL